MAAGAAVLFPRFRTTDHERLQKDLFRPLLFSVGLAIFMILFLKETGHAIMKKSQSKMQHNGIHQRNIQIGNSLSNSHIMGISKAASIYKETVEG